MLDRFITRLDELEVRLDELIPHTKTCVGLNSFHIELIKLECDSLRAAIAKASNKDIAYIGSNLSYIEKYYTIINSANMSFQVSRRNNNDIPVDKDADPAVGYYKNSIRYGKYDELLVYQDDASENDQPVLTCGIREKWYELYLVMPDNKIAIFLTPTCVETLDHTYDPHTLLEYCNRMGIWIDTNSLDMIIGRWTNNTLELVPDMDS